MGQVKIIQRSRVALATVGGIAVVVMAGVTVVMGTGTDPVPTAHPIMVGPMTEGGTATTTTPPTALPTQKAAPLLKAPRYGKG